MKAPYILSNRSDQILLGVGVVAIAAGVGYYIYKRKSNTPVIDTVEPDTDIVAPAPEPKATIFHSLSDLSAVAEEPTKLPEGPIDYAHIVQSYVSEAVPAVQNVFNLASDNWNDEVERNNRTPDKPYVIHIEEWRNDEMGYRQETVEYYALDDIMVDMHDVVIYDHAGKMGELKWGHGTNDPETVYIRNEQLEMEWEVCFNAGSYQVEVLGLELEAQGEAELKHSVRRFRDE